MTDKQLAPGIHREITLPHVQEFELYHNAFSLCSMKTRVCLAELGVDYKSHHIDLIETGCYENVRPDYIRVHPGKTVPLLVHEGHPIYESHEQIRYAAEHSPAENNLLPEPGPERDFVNKWIDLSSITDDPISNTQLSAGNAVAGLTIPLFATMVEKIRYRLIFEGLRRHFDKKRPLMFATMKLRGIHGLAKMAPIRLILKTSQQDMHRHLDALETQLGSSDGPWLAAENFTLADVSWLVIFERLKQVDSLNVFLGPDQRPACSRYWEALQQRPSYAGAISAHAHPIVTYGTKRIVEAKAKDSAVKELLEGC